MKYLPSYKAAFRLLLLLLPLQGMFAQTPVIQATANAPTKPVNPVPQGVSALTRVNFVRSWHAQRPITDEAVLAATTRTRQEVKKTTQYFDGLGRPLQTVEWQASVLAKDMVAPVVYDEFGRETYKYLPYISTSADGKFKPAAFNEQAAFCDAFFAGEDVFYSMTEFEASPLNRVSKSLAQGNSWAGSGKGIALQYMINTATDSVRAWSIGPLAGSTPVSTGFYAPGQLFKTITTDERNYDVVEYKDKSGRVVLKKTETTTNSYTGPTGWYNTYYIYDDLGNLRYVLQPKATAWLLANSWTFESTSWSGSTIAKELCFSYEYDHRNRMTIKRVPGAGEVWMVYDARERLVMTQDENRRAEGKWLYTDYDSQNRPVRTGIWTTGGDRVYHQGLAGTSTTYPAPGAGTYTALTEIYYDDYSWVAGSGSGLSSTLITANGVTGATYFYSSSNSVFPYPRSITASYVTTGMVTGAKTLVAGTGTYLYSVNFYDDRGRVIETHQTNYSGGKDTVVTQYSFTGQALRTLVCHQKGGTNTQAYRVLTKMEYDAAGRLLKIYKKTGKSPEVTISENRYDELGQLDGKYLGKTRNSSSQNTYTSTALDYLEYDYNIRGWLRGINKDYARNANGADDWFGMELNYDYGFTTSYYNGNIAGMRWRSKGDGEQRAYGFTYDALNRLTKANFTQNTNAAWNVSAGIDFSVTGMSYDQNGNITRLYQKGLVVNQSRLIDSLYYGYVSNSNRLNYVNDKVNDVNSTLGDFKEVTNNTSQDYWYDGNGNMTKDNNKGISGITYNYLNLPDMVSVTGKGTVQYVYDAAGVKLRKITTDNTVTPSVTTRTDYIGPFTYRNDTLEMIAQEEGRIRPKRPGFTDTMFYDYFEKDHLGNVRVVLTDELQKDMYPVASLETTPLPTERVYYDRVDSGRVGKPAGYPADSYTSTNNWVQKLRGNGVKIGTSLLLKVTSGDKVSVRVSSWFNMNGATPGPPASPLAGIVLALTEGLPGASGGKVAATQLGSTVLDPQVLDFLSDRDAGLVTAMPKAYLNMVLLDEQLKPVVTNNGKNSYFEQVSQNNVLGVLDVTDREITKSGYLYVYVSNETQNIDVYFDNLQVTHTRGPLLEETHYYPFGLTMAGISSKAGGKLTNKYKYNGIEQDTDFDLNIYDAFYRNLDPQTGRFWQVDPVTTHNESPYVSMGNNPILSKDWLGNYYTWANEGVHDRYKRMRKENTDLMQGYMTELSGLDLNSTDEAVQGQIEQLTNLINMHGELSCQWDEMDASPIEFYVSDKTPKGALGLAHYNSRENRVELSTGANDRSDQLKTMVHELRHGYGFLNGELMEGAMLNDMTDEIVAYNAEFLFAGRGSANLVVEGYFDAQWFNKTFTKKGDYEYLKNRELSLTTNTLATIVMQYTQSKTIQERVLNYVNLNNANMTIGQVMEGLNNFSKRTPPEFEFENFLNKRKP